MHNWQGYHSSNWYEIDQKNAVLNLALCCGAIRRHREKAQYRCTTAVHHVRTKSHTVSKFSKIFFEQLMAEGFEKSSTAVV